MSDRFDRIEEGLRYDGPVAPLVDEFGCDYDTGEQVRPPSWRPGIPAPTEDDRCDHCGAHGHRGLCRVCEDALEPIVQRWDPLAGYEAGEPA